MNPAVLALIWLAGGAVALLLPRRLHLRRSAFAVPVIISIVTMTQGSNAHNAGILSGNAGLILTRGDAGVITLSSFAVALLIVIAPQSTTWDVAFICTTAAAAVFMLSAQSPLIFGAAALAAIFLLSVRWLSIAPGRATLAAGRVPAMGAALVLAAAVFMPVSPYLNGARAEFLAAVMILAAVAMSGSIFGWLHSSLSTLPAASAAPWPFFMLPAVLLSLTRIGDSFPSDARVLLLHWLMIAGLVSAIWNAINSITAAPEQRYARVLLADVSLFLAAIGTHTTEAESGAVLILICHLITAPLLLQRPEAMLRRQRILGWIAMSGLPLLPSFWGRFLVLQGTAAVSGYAAFGCALTLGLLFIAGIRVITGRHNSEPMPRLNARPLLAWFPVVGAAAFGVAPALIAGVILGAWS